MSLFSVSGLSSFKDLKLTYFKKTLSIACEIRKTIQRNLNYDKYVQFFIAPMDEAWFHEKDNGHGKE